MLDKLFVHMRACTRAIYIETPAFSVQFNFSLLHRNIRFSSFQMETYAVYFSQNLRNKNSRNNLYAKVLSFAEKPVSLRNKMAVRRWRNYLSNFR